MIGGIIVSNPACGNSVISSGIIKKKDNRISEPAISDTTAAGMFAFFQNNPNVRGANAPAKTMSNAKIR